MRRIIWVLLVVSAAVGLAMSMRFNDGNLAILWPPYRIDVSVNLAILILLLTFVVLHWLVVALSGVWRLPTRVREYRERRRRKGALLSLRNSLFALFEGRFGRAERLARTALKDPLLAGAASVVAARAAHRMGEDERRNHWLQSAREESGAWHAQLVTSAELALENGRAQDALAALHTLQSAGSRHLHVLRLRLRAEELAGDWPAVLQTLRELDKRDALEAQDARDVRLRAWTATFAAADPAAVHKLYASLRADELALDGIVLAAARAFVRAGQAAQAARAIERTLDTRYSGLLLRLYATLDAVPARDRLAMAERWRSRYGDDADMLMALGRLCTAEGLWGKAEEFLLQAETAGSGAPGQFLLAQLYEAMGERADEANERFRRAAFEALDTETGACREPVLAGTAATLAAASPTAARLPALPGS